MKPGTPPEPEPVTTSSSVKNILKRHGASLHIHGARGSSHKRIAEDLLTELTEEQTRTSAVQNNLNAMLNQWQTTSASLKALQARNQEMYAEYQQKLAELNNRLEAANGSTDDPDTDTEGK